MLALSERWAPKLNSQPETGIGYQICTVVLKDGRRIERVTIVSGIITKAEGFSAIPFVEDDIEGIIVTHGR